MNSLEMESAETTDRPTIWRRYGVTAGRILVARRQVKETLGGGKILATQERIAINQQFEPWATVLMIGPPRLTEYGTKVEPDPRLCEGMTVLLNPTGGRDVEIGDGSEKMTVTCIPFEGIMMLDLEEEVP